MSELKINTYPLHIGDWHSGTSRMSLAEAGAYIRLIHSYLQDGGSQLSIEGAYGLCGAVSRADRLAVRRVLAMKFVKVDSGYTCQYADDILSQMVAQPWRWRDREWSRPYMADAVRLAVFERDGYLCQYCFTGDGPFEVDHVHPVSRGGGDDFDNLVCACVPCNRSKGAKLLTEWRCEA